jgi:REP element-mobilizing transposase RayT
MEIGRKRLPHQPPWSVDPSDEIYFLTICAQVRTGSPLLCVAPDLLDSIRFNNDRGTWWTHVAVVMPDHVHLIVRFPPDAEFVRVVRRWKHWTARNLGVGWQRDFFDHRLRREESLDEKVQYVMNNPVRAGLVDDYQQWPHLWLAEGPRTW